MEIEFKYVFPEEITVENTYEYLFNSPYIMEMMSGDVRKIEMFSKYFDTDDKDLRKRRITLRMREENNNIVLTLKHGGNTENGLHKRYEENVLCKEEVLNLGLLSHTSLYNELLFLNNNKGGLSERFGAKFTRYAVLLNEIESDTKMELSLDVGYLFNYESGSGTKEPICEAELEFVSGSECVFERIGAEIITELKLQPFNKSKASRATAL